MIKLLDYLPMERMSFFIPPVFLFGNKVRYDQEKKKAEYKTAAETEIQIKNREIERIAELEEENQKLKERIKELETTNKKRTADNWATFKS